MNRARLAIGVTLSVAVGSATFARAQVRGTIFGPGTRSYPVAVAPLKNLAGPGGDLGVRVS